LAFEFEIRVKNAPSMKLPHSFRVKYESNYSVFTVLHQKHTGCIKIMSHNEISVPCKSVMLTEFNSLQTDDKETGVFICSQHMVLNILCQNSYCRGEGMLSGVVY
jgi:hypothetical protein